MFIKKALSIESATIATLALTFTNIIFPTITKAQITTDGTTSTSLTPTDNGIRIDNGNVAGNNLFHSFGEFSVPTGTEAFFNNSNDVANIFSRVTAGNISNIDGLIRANGGANLFLINPAGILFGANASLNIGGSFYGSTADSVIFSDGVEFAASNPIQPVLTVNAPIGLRFRENPGDIVNQSVANELGLVVAPRQNLALIGGNITVAGGRITAPVGTGNIELGSVAANNTVNLEPENSSFQVTYDGVTDFKNITLDRDATILTSESSINLRGDFIVLDNGSNIGSNIDSIFFTAPEGSNVASGSINLKARQLLINNRANIFTSTFLEGNAGNINVDVAESVTIIGTGFEEIQTTLLQEAITQPDSLRIEEILEQSTGILTGTGETGKSANINITAVSLQLQEGGIIGGTTIQKGSLGTVKLNIKDSLNVVGGGIFNNPLSGSTGVGNSIEIKTGSLTISDGGSINSAVLGTGEGGDITIEATEEINILRTPPNALVATGIFSSSVIEDGMAGDIKIDTKRLKIQDGGQITSSSGLEISDIGIGESTVNNTRTITLGGKGGNIKINASESVEISGNDSHSVFSSGIVSNTFTENNAGNINIETSSISVTNRARISANTSDQGDGGIIRINAAKKIEIIGNESFNDKNTGIFSSSEEQSTGDAGGVRVTTSDFSIRDGRISVSGEVQGDGGTLEIITDSLNLDNSSIEADTNSGMGANVNLNVIDNLVLDNNSRISAIASDEAVDSGNVEIRSGLILAFPSQVPNDGNDIVASAPQGNGGNITVTADAILGIEERDAVPNNGTNDIDASSEFGANLILQNKIIETDRSEVKLVEQSQVADRLCQANQNQNTNSFTINGKGGIPPLPNSLLNADVLLDDEKLITTNTSKLNNQKQTQVQPVKTSQGDIYPARGIIFNQDGTIILTAYNTNKSSQRLPNNSPNCSD